MKIPYHKPWIDRGAIDEVNDTLESGWLTTGPKTDRFEADFAEYQGVKHAVGVTSCTAALHIALAALGIGPGDEVITTPITFGATANVIEMVGARPIFADVDPATRNLDPAAAAAAVTPRTKAIIPVHYAGQPVEIDALQALTEKHGLHVVYDCAHAIEARWGGAPVAGFGDAACYSFYANKNMTTGEGGMLTTNNPELAEKFRLLRNHGLSKSAFDRSGDDRYHPYEIVAPGFKYNMFDIQAALGLRQLPKVEEWLARRERLAARYDEAFAPLPACETLQIRPNRRTARHLYPILVADRSDFMARLNDCGIGTGVHFTALHLNACYREKYGFKPGAFPNAEFIGERTVSLPMFPLLTDDEASYIIDSTCAILAESAPVRP